MHYRWGTGRWRSNYSSVNHHLSIFTHQVPWILDHACFFASAASRCKRSCAPVSPRTSSQPKPTVASAAVASKMPSTPTHAAAARMTEAAAYEEACEWWHPRPRSRKEKKISQHDRAAPHRARSKARRSIAQQGTYTPIMEQLSMTTGGVFLQKRRRAPHCRSQDMKDFHGFMLKG